MDGRADQRFAVVGGSGFVGRALVERLRGEGRVVGIARSGGNVRVESYLDTAQVAAAIGPDCDTVFHLAALAHTTGQDAAAFDRANVDGAVAVARAAIARGVRRFVFVSSIGVLGNETPAVAFDEESTPRPAADYARSKLRAEVALAELFAPTAVELAIVRPPLVHGPGAPGNFGRLMALARRPLPLPFGSIRNVRSLVGIENLVDFLVVVARAPALPGYPLLVTDGESISTADLVRTLAAQPSGRAVVVPFPAAVIERAAALIGRRDMARQLIGSLRIDASRSARFFGWHPPRTLREGLALAMAGTR